MKKLLTPALLALTPVALTPVLMTTVSCGEQDHIDKSVGNADELQEALNDPTIKTIGLSDDIFLSPTTPTNGEPYGLLIERDVKIIGNGNTIMFNDMGTELVPYRVCAIWINPKEGKAIDVTIKNLNVKVASQNGYREGIKVENADGSTINLINTEVSFAHQTGYQLGYAMHFRSNILKGFTINLTRCKLEGYAAIYNQADLVDFEANECTFIGHNDDSTTEHSYFEGNDFAVVRVTDMPLNTMGGYPVNHNFNRDNSFVFNRCMFESHIKTGATKEWRSEIPVENISPANNQVYLNSCNVKTDVENLKDDQLYVCIGNNKLITNDALVDYKNNSAFKADWPENLVPTSDAYYAFYKDAKHSTIFVNGKAVKTHDMDTNGVWEVGE